MGNHGGIVFHQMAIFFLTVLQRLTRGFQLGHIPGNGEQAGPAFQYDGFTGDGHDDGFSIPAKESSPEITHPPLNPHASGKLQKFIRVRPEIKVPEGASNHLIAIVSHDMEKRIVDFNKMVIRHGGDT